MPLEIDLGQLEKLASFQCTLAEAASFFGVSERTMDNRMREPEFRAAWERGIGMGRISLRRKQWKLAERNAAMAIFLGKQYLGQRDVMEHAGANGGPIEVEVRDALGSKLEALAKRLEEAEAAQQRAA